MFEQSTLSSGPASKRLWTTCVGITGEALLLGVAILAPMLWPQVLPRTTLITSLLPPVPQPPPRAAVVRPRPTQASVPRSNVVYHSEFYAPRNYPAKIYEGPEPEMADRGVAGSVPTGAQGGVPDGVLGGILRAGAPPVPAPRVAETHHAAVATSALAEIKRVPVGGNVKMAHILHRVEPEYPLIAKQARVSGVVELVGVIGIDGRLKELRLVSGHALLARAAMEAVSQWIYTPTLLNGEPVEVIAPITVTFRLN